MTKNQFKCVSTEVSVFGMYMLISQRLFMSSSFNLFRILSIPHSVNLLPLEYQLEDSIYINSKMFQWMPLPKKKPLIQNKHNKTGFKLNDCADP